MAASQPEARDKEEKLTDAGTDGAPEPKADSEEQAAATKDDAKSADAGDEDEKAASDEAKPAAAAGADETQEEGEAAAAKGDDEGKSEEATAGKSDEDDDASDEKEKVAAAEDDEPKAKPRKRRKKRKKRNSRRPAADDLDVEDATPSGMSLATAPVADAELDNEFGGFFDGAKSAEREMVKEQAKEFAATIAHMQQTQGVLTQKEVDERRQKYRRIVAAVVTVAAVAAILAIAKVYTGPTDKGERVYKPGTGVTATAPSETTKAPVKPTAEATSTAATSEAPAASASAVSSAEPAASASASGDEEPPPEEESGEKDPKAAKKLGKKAAAALNHNKWKDAIKHAKAAVAANPEDASAYLYWGSALQGMGKKKEAKEVFARCAKKAKTGPRGECRALR